jgi:glucose-1-phosphate adenylyltransferase
MRPKTYNRPGTLGLILAGGRVDELTALTVLRPKSAMPFGGMYRIIDCALTNLSTSGINRIGILSQYRPLSLMDHVRNGKYWDLQGFRKGVSFLPPHTGETDADWYKGTADALYQNISFIEQHNSPLTLVVSGDHIYRMNYNALYDVMDKTDADMVIALTPVDSEKARQYGLAVVGPDNMIQRYVEKPEVPCSELASMTVYLFKTDILVKELEQNARTGKTFQIYDEIIPGLVKKGRVAAYVYDGYWSYSRTLDEYYRANMDCLEDNPKIDLEQWQLFTNYDIGRTGDHPPVRTQSDALIENSIVSPGCSIMGTVKNSVLSPLVAVGYGSEVIDSIVMEGAVIGRESIVHSSIVDKNVTIGNRVSIGCQTGNKTVPDPNNRFPSLLNCGLTIIGKRTLLSDKMTVGSNVIIYPESNPRFYYGLHVRNGMTISAEE